MTSDTQIPPPQRRESPDPHEQANPIPKPLFVLVALLVATGAAYISGSDIETPAAWGDGRQAEELRGSSGAGPVASDGAAIFAARCAPCHQATGQGLPGVFPPLAGSEWVNGKDSTVAAIVIHGITGSLTVKGSHYDGAMPTFGTQLSDDEIAAVLTYVRAQWGNKAAPVTTETVAMTRETHKSRTTPFAGDQDLPPHD
jgi:mono/diheme cytochrome c family protein